MSRIDVADIIERLEGDENSYRDDQAAAQALRLLSAEVAAWRRKWGHLRGIARSESLDGACKATNAGLVLPAGGESK